MKTLTPEHKLALAEGRKASKWQVTTIDLGDGWQVKHVDQWNYEVYNKGEPCGYFTTLRDALIGVTRKATGKGLNGNLESIVSRMDAVEAWVHSPAFCLIGKE